MTIDLLNFTPETVLPTPANAADPYWYDEARALLVRIAAVVQEEGGSWGDVRLTLTGGNGKHDRFFPAGMSEAERASIVSTALFATRWRDLGDDAHS